jgi:hypothetical protein
MAQGNGRVTRTQPTEPPMDDPPPPAPSSRLWLRLVLWLALPVAVFPALTSGLLQPWINRQLDAQLAETALLMLPLIELRMAGAPTEGMVLPNPGSGEYIAWVLRDRTGTIRMMSSDVDDAVFAQPAPQGRSRDASLANRILSVTSADGTWTLELVDPFGRRGQARDAALRDVLVPAAVFGPVAMIAIFAAFRRKP